MSEPVSPPAASTPQAQVSHVASGELYRRLLRRVRPHWRVFAGAIVAMVITAATEPLFPALAKYLLDSGFSAKNAADVYLIPAAMIGIFFVRGIATYATTYCMTWVASRVVMDLRGEMFARLLTLPTRFYDNQSTGALISRVAYDVTNVTGAATQALTVAVRDSLTILGLLGYLFYLDWKLTLISLTVGPVIFATVRAFGKRLRAASRASFSATGLITHILEETVGAHKVVKIFGGQAYEAKRFGEATNTFRRTTMREAMSGAAATPLTQMAAVLSVALITYLALSQSAQQQTTVGGFISFIAALLMMLAPLKRLTDVSSTIQRGLAAAESVWHVLDETPEDDNGKVELGSNSGGRARGHVRVEHVGFTYPQATRPALVDIDLDVAPGQTVALVGPSGSGKTTLAALIPRFYHPTSGRLLIDGHPLETLTLASLRANIALVSQDVVLFNDTVRANIAYGGSAQASDEDVIRAAKAANAWDFIQQMPQGLETQVGENGVKLSGGQRQRLAIARAFLKNAPILILDEATSALDSESERQIQGALEELIVGRTTIVIAHRLSTIEKADRIVVLSNGRIVEAGPHSELLRQNGLYASLHRLQTEGREGHEPVPA
jgi:ATP-binding cassette, subfamily B, bacterial MsbA